MQSFFPSPLQPNPSLKQAVVKFSFLLPNTISNFTSSTGLFSFYIYLFGLHWTKSEKQSSVYQGKINIILLQGRNTWPSFVEYNKYSLKEASE